MDGVFSVAEVVRYLGDILQEDVVLSGLWVSGEISNLSHSSVGHTYFTLKDAESQLKCVIFRNSGATKSQVKQLKNGDNVIVHGRVGIYDVTGAVQLYADHVQSAGVGILHLRYEELCTKLRAEGLFEETRKRPIPPLPCRIGVVSSAQAAAFQDICRILQERFPAVEVVLAATLVQGAEAPDQIVDAIARLNQIGDIDVIIVARGGGSIEDLWAFNDERVARAISASSVPIVTGIGHETDMTISDLVADLRAPTPTAAAISVVPDRGVLLEHIQSLRDEIARVVREQVSSRFAELHSFERDLNASSPARQIARWTQYVDDHLQLLIERASRHLTIRSERVAARRSELDLLSPLASLSRGYALVVDTNGRIVHDARRLHEGDDISLWLRDGTADATVTGVQLGSDDKFTGSAVHEAGN